MRLQWPVAKQADKKDPNAKLTREDKNLILGMKEEGYSALEIAEEIGCAPSTVYNFLTAEKNRKEQRDRDAFERDPFGAVRVEAARELAGDPEVRAIIRRQAKDELLAPLGGAARSSSGKFDWIIPLVREENMKPVLSALGTAVARAVPPDVKDQAVTSYMEQAKQLQQVVQQLVTLIPGASMQEDGKIYVPQEILDAAQQRQLPRPESAGALPPPSDEPDVPDAPDPVNELGALLLQWIDLDPETAAAQAKGEIERFPAAWSAIHDHTFDELQVGIGLSPALRAAAGAGALNELPEQVIDFWRLHPDWLFKFREALLADG